MEIKYFKLPILIFPFYNIKLHIVKYLLLNNDNKDTHKSRLEMVPQHFQHLALKNKKTPDKRTSCHYSATTQLQMIEYSNYATFCCSLIPSVSLCAFDLADFMPNTLSYASPKEFESPTRGETGDFCLVNV